MSAPLTSLQVAKARKGIERADLAELLMFKFHVETLLSAVRGRLKTLQQPVDDSQDELPL